MSQQIPSIQFFANIPEELSGVSLRRLKASGHHLAVLKFDKLASLENFLSFRKSSANALHLIDEEGEMLIEPRSFRLLYGGPEGEDLQGVECRLEIPQEEHWERFMRFMHRYAEANDLAYGEPSSNQSRS